MKDLPVMILAEDHRRLVRELDAAMHGEEDAAPQASLCDLVPLARRLRADRDAARQLHAAGRRYTKALEDVIATNIDRMCARCDKDYDTINTAVKNSKARKAARTRPRQVQKRAAATAAARRLRHPLPPNWK